MAKTQPLRVSIYFPGRFGHLDLHSKYTQVLKSCPSCSSSLVLLLEKFGEVTSSRESSPDQGSRRLKSSTDTTRAFRDREQKATPRKVAGSPLSGGLYCSHCGLHILPEENTVVGRDRSMADPRTPGGRPAPAAHTPDRRGMDALSPRSGSTTQSRTMNSREDPAIWSPRKVLSDTVGSTSHQPQKTTTSRPEKELLLDDEEYKAWEQKMQKEFSEFLANVRHQVGQREQLLQKYQIELCRRDRVMQANEEDVLDREDRLTRGEEELRQRKERWKKYKDDMMKQLQQQMHQLRVQHGDGRERNGYHAHAHEVQSQTNGFKVNPDAPAPAGAGDHKSGAMASWKPPPGAVKLPQSPQSPPGEGGRSHTPNPQSPNYRSPVADPQLSSQTSPVNRQYGLGSSGRSGDPGYKGSTTSYGISEKTVKMTGPQGTVEVSAKRYEGNTPIQRGQSSPMKAEHDIRRVKGSPPSYGTPVSSTSQQSRPTTLPFGTQIPTNSELTSPASQSSSAQYTTGRVVRSPSYEVIEGKNGWPILDKTKLEKAAKEDRVVHRREDLSFSMTGGTGRSSSRSTSGSVRDPYNRGDLTHLGNGGSRNESTPPVRHEREDVSRSLTGGSGRVPSSHSGNSAGGTYRDTSHHDPRSSSAPPPRVEGGGDTRGHAREDTNMNHPRYGDDIVPPGKPSRSTSLSSILRKDDAKQTMTRSKSTSLYSSSREVKGQPPVKGSSTVAQQRIPGISSQSSNSRLDDKSQWKIRNRRRGEEEVNDRLRAQQRLAPKERYVGGVSKSSSLKRENERASARHSSSQIDDAAWQRRLEEVEARERRSSEDSGSEKYFQISPTYKKLLSDLEKERSSLVITSSSGRKEESNSVDKVNGEVDEPPLTPKTPSKTRMKLPNYNSYIRAVQNKDVDDVDI